MRPLVLLHLHAEVLHEATEEVLHRLRELLLVGLVLGVDVQSADESLAGELPDAHVSDGDHAFQLSYLFVCLFVCGLVGDELCVREREREAVLERAEGRGRSQSALRCGREQHTYKRERERELFADGHL